MKYLLVVVLSGAILSCMPAGENPEQLITEAKALDAAWLEAYNARNLEAVMAGYWNSPDLVSYPPGAMEIKGWENMKAQLQQEFSMGPGGKLEILTSNYTVHGNVVSTNGTWRYTMAGPDGAPMEFLGRYSDLKAKHAGKLVYIMDHASVPLPPPPDEQKMP